MAITQARSAPSAMSCSVSLIQVQPKNVLHWWILVSGLLKPVIEGSRGRISDQTVIEDLKCGNWQLWVALDGPDVMGAMTTEVVKYRTGLTVCIVHLLSGRDSESWYPLLCDVDQWARENGCTEMECRSRPGLGRKFPDWKQTGVYYARSIAK